MSKTCSSFSVNGQLREVETAPTKTLLNVLREELGLTGTKDGCSSGDCGACVVLLDGKVVNSCMVLAAQADGGSVTTVEGIAPCEDVNGELHPLQDAFAQTWAFQCGFCTQGMLVSCYALLKSNDNPSRDEILAAISGNFCRCTGYQAVVKAVQQAAAELRSSGPGEDNKNA